jgi:hypothetical protein
MQIAKRFANQIEATQQTSRSKRMTMKNKVAALAFVALSVTAASTGAQAQTALQNGATVGVSMTEQTLNGANTIDLGSAGTTGWVTTMPMSLSYGSTNLNISFGGNGAEAGVYYGSTQNVANAPPLGTNYFVARNTGSVTLDFSNAQRSLSMYWGTPGDTNSLSFYRGGQLVASTTGAAMASLMTAAGSPNVTYPNIPINYIEGAYAQFSFNELGFDKVVATNTSNYFEFGDVSFSNQPVDAAPIPLNAASLGGLMSFLMMLAMRGKSGTQVAIRMAFASLMPRRRGMA